MCEDVPLFRVKCCKASPKDNLTELEVVNYRNEAIVSCYLYDSWYVSFFYFSFSSLIVLLNNFLFFKRYFFIMLFSFRERT